MNPTTSTGVFTPLKPLKARYIMIGGFLGAGKTTAIGKLARRFSDQGLRVGLVTNDQGQNLVDTAMLSSQGFTTEEIPGGCFCCRFNSLIEASQRLMTSTRPDVLIAEPVGSCTDLAATVTYPLRKLYSDRFTVSPISVLIDPIRALRAFGVEAGPSFSEKVLYIYFKQIEEADLVVISKCDLLDGARLASLRRAIETRFPGKEIMAISAHRGTNLEAWFARITQSEQKATAAMPVDYEIYADGEALLGWLNCTVQITATREFDANALLKTLAAQIHQRLRNANAEVAHLKMTFSAGEASQSIAAVNLVRNDFVPELSFQLNQPQKSGVVIINLRAEAAPDVLATAVREGVDATTKEFSMVQTSLDHLQHFRPGKPTPTHRMTSLLAGA